LPSWLVLCCALPSIAAAADFFRLFPADPEIANLTHGGQTSFTQTYTPSGSIWTAGLDEREVFFASLKHTETADTTWEVRIGKGGQLYSIRGLFGESQAPQGQPNAHWIDQIFQLVGVDRALNKSKPNHAYFIHQAGGRSDFEVNLLFPDAGKRFDAAGRAAYTLNWGQQAHVPNVNHAALLYYERVTDLGSGVIELTYVIYNFGRDPIDYHNALWGGVRKSALPVNLVGNPDGSFKAIAGVFGRGSLLDLNNTGAWIAWTKNAADPSSPTMP
jgi:hypothetical protein